VSYHTTTTVGFTVDGLLMTTDYTRLETSRREAYICVIVATDIVTGD